MMSAAEREDLRRLPKAELHVHLEGSLTPEVVWELAQRHGNPCGLADLDACRRLYQFSDFAGFIRAIKTASLHLLEPSDYAAAVIALARQLQAQGVVYAEVFLSLGILLWRQVQIEPYWEAVEIARLAAEAETGVRLRWIFDAVRQFGAEQFEKVVGWTIKLQSSPSVIGVGIGGDETQVPTAAFAPGYARARAAGLYATVHAGETRGPESVWEVLNLLQPDRIGHGLNAFRDSRLLDRLAADGVSLDICPSSNLKTGAWPVGERHPVRTFYKHKINLAVSTDDPGIFGCTLLDELALLRREHGFSAAEIHEVAENAWSCSFLSPTERRAMLGGLPRLAAPEPRGDGRV